MFSPVLWAREFLDWHCLDPDGEVWKRKTEEGSLGGLPKYDPIRAKEGKSIFHRPYQYEMIQCTSKRKIFRIGRQSGKSESLCIVTLFNLFTHENFNVEIIAPYQSQIDLVFKRLSELIESNIELVNSIKRNVKAPHYTIELKNGSIVKGFSAGTRSKQDAGSSRGQHANMLVFDECFVESTQISTPYGKKKIIDINPGDDVISFDNRDDLHIDQVVSIKNTGYKEVFKYTLEDGTFIECTPNHPIWNGQDFIPIDSSKFILRHKKSIIVKIGLFIRDRVIGDFFKINIVKKEYLGVKPVYNLETKKFHTFFANDIAVHNCDYLSREDINAALAVIINYPDATVWMSSTPTGKRDKFYESAQNPQYREFHFPSQVNPNWTQELEDYFKSELTIDGYNHEILAIYGEQEEGVYQLKYIEAAQEDFEYHKISPNPQWTYSIGVDWNDIKIGTTIAVIGFNPIENMFYVVDKHIIQRAEKTQMTACNKIVEINRLWNPFAIYIDSGYGSVQYELLHDFGQKSIASKGPNHPDSKLRTIVKQYDFGSSIEIKDPFTKQPVKKPAKPFLIDNSVRRFESLQVKYPKSDSDFTKQLQNYIIDRVSITGRPVYKAQIETIGDHFLDAVNLGLVSFTLEKSIFGQTIYSSKIAIVNKLGEDSFSSNTLIDEANKHKPKLGRIDGITKDNKVLRNINGSIPAFNTKHETKIWAFDGFFRDEPAPSRKTTKYSIFTSKGKIRPSRSKF